MAEPGWYDDERDPTLARWWDGEHWTAHTVVVAEWRGAGAPPPPPVDEPPLESPALPLGRSPALRGRARVGVPVVAIAAVGAIALALSGGDDPGDPREIRGTGSGEIDIADAVDIAQTLLTFPVPDSALEQIIRGLCDAGEGAGTEVVVADAAALPVDADWKLEAAVEAAGNGAQALCPEAVGPDADELLEAVYDAAVVLWRLPPTTTTVPLTATSPPTDGATTTSPSTPG